MRGGVAVAADDGHAGLREAEFRPYHVDDALLRVVEIVEVNAELPAVGAERVDLLLGHRIEDRQAAVGGGHVMVGGGHGPLGTPHLAAGEPQPFKRLRAGHFVNQLQVDVQQRLLPRLGMDDVGVPNLLENGFAHFYRASSRWSSSSTCFWIVPLNIIAIRGIWTESVHVGRPDLDGALHADAHRGKAEAQGVAVPLVVGVADLGGVVAAKLLGRGLESAHGLLLAKVVGNGYGYLRHGLLQTNDLSRSRKVRRRREGFPPRIIYAHLAIFAFSAR